jgi:hypothetical protein
MRRALAGVGRLIRGGLIFLTSPLGFLVGLTVFLFIAAALGWFKY